MAASNGRRRAMLIVALAAAGGLLLPTTPRAAAQPTHATHAAIQTIPRTVLEQPIKRRSGIGVAHEPVSTQSPEAQAWYDEGLAHLHSFAWLDAARAFHAALRVDPQLAMAQVGLSFAFGGLGSMQGATDALQQARRLERAAGPRDRLRIDLRARQLRASTDGAAAADYVSALERALLAYPSDVELLLLRGEAAGTTTGTTTGGTGMQADASAVPFFERAQRAAPNAFAPRHYLAHAYENSGQIALALRESEAYARMAPAVPHAHHMRAHSLRRSGRPQDAIAAFEHAATLTKAAREADPSPGQYDWHQHHNTNLLAGTYWYVGRLQSAERLLREAFTSAAPLLPEELNKRDWPAILLAHGALADALAAAQRLAQHEHPIVRAAGHLAAAHVHMAAGRLPAAGSAADAALRDLRAGGPEAAELAPELRMAQGEYLLRGGDRERGRSMIRLATASLRARPGPDAWSHTLFALEAATRAARVAGDTELAAELSEAMRQHDAGYAGTAFALALVAESRGDRAGAARAFRDAAQRWQDADADHPDAAEARRRVTALKNTSPR